MTNGKIAFVFTIVTSTRSWHGNTFTISAQRPLQWAIAAWHQGMIDTAKAAREQAFGIAARLNHHNTTAYALYCGVLPAFFEGFEAWQSTLLDCSNTRHAMDFQWTAWTSPLAGAAQAYAGRVDDGVVAIERGIAHATISRMSQCARFFFRLAEGS
jgi:hypothetical protein